MLSLRKILYSVFFAVAALLALVVILGLLHYRYTREYDTIIYQGEKLLFRFDTLHEQLTSNMISGTASDAEASANKVDALNSDISRLLENTLVPGEYKLALINQVDLAGIALLARKVSENPQDRKTALELHDQLRKLSENLMQFDRVLSGQMKSRLVRFQGLAIGALTFIIASVSLLVLFLYQKALIPLISLAQYLENPDPESPLEVDPKSCKEIAELTRQVNLMIAEGAYVSVHGGEGKGFFTLSPKELNNLSNYLTGIINYNQLLIDQSEEHDDVESLELLNKVRETGEQMSLILSNKIGGNKGDG
ncbi:MAG: hypothetical protein OEM01_10200 [Desulfobulbaceae bacterium]|nr:hypothetical protein [Desulfobulbaceae bacterium]